mmetsp:Transcript_13494/g.19822  ORF Transcript_13494/g.19822 Transcript_13494/m.19822 type:complete len:322 (+) Transcript_13494:110-1075(+)
MNEVLIFECRIVYWLEVTYWKSCLLFLIKTGLTCVCFHIIWMWSGRLHSRGCTSGRLCLGRSGEQAQPAQQAQQLQQRVQPLGDPHVGQAYLPQHRQLAGFLHLQLLPHPKEGPNDVHGGIPRFPQIFQVLLGPIDVVLQALVEHALGPQGVGLVADLEHVLRGDAAKARVGRLQVVEGVPHVPLGCEYQRLQSRWLVVQLLRLAHLLQPLQHLFVRQLGVSQDCAAALDGLDDLLRVVAGQGKPGRVAVDLHGPAQCLLRLGGHAVSLVQDDDLVPPRWEGDLLLGEHLDLVPHHVDAPGIRRVQLQHRILVCIPKHRSG